jgi:hypothetical protein
MPEGAETNVTLSPAALRKLVSGEVRKGIRRFAEAQGIDVDDDEPPQTSRGRGEPVDAAALRKQIKDELKAEMDAEREKEKLARKAQDDAKLSEKSRQDEMAAIQRAADLKVELLAAGVKRKDLSLVMSLHEAGFKGLVDDAAKAAFTPEAFVSSLHDRPYFFEDGKAPKAPATGKTTTTTAASTAAVRAGTETVTPKDWTGKSLPEIKAEIARVRGVPNP